MRKIAASTTGIDVPAVAIAPPLRCFHRGGDSARSICGELAFWSRPGRWWFEVAYYCEKHRNGADLPIAAEHVFRRVRLSGNVLISAAHINAPIAETEALARLERAVELAGGVLMVSTLSSNVVRSFALPAAGDAIDMPGDPE